MPATASLFAIRGSKGVSMRRIDEFGKGSEEVRVWKTEACRVMKFSPSGDYFAFCDGQQTVCIRCQTMEEVLCLDLPKTSGLHFSTLGSFLAIFEPFYIKKDEEPKPNVKVYNLMDGSVACEFIQKKWVDWNPQWTADELIASRMSGSEIYFYENTKSFDRYSHKLVLQNVRAYSPSQVSSPHHILTYVPGTKSQPCFLRVYRYPNFQGSGSAVCNKSFFKSDRVEMKWNPEGTAVLAMSTADVDKSGSSYYGEQTMYILNVNGEASRVELAKEGPIYSYEWSPSSSEFCMVYGFMPAKATLFTIKGTTVFDFGTGPRNEVSYNCFGNLFCLSGFGNLRGEVAVWSRNPEKQVSHLVAEDTTQFAWAPDGQHFVAATTAPRLRVNNGFRVWHYSGKIVETIPQPLGNELWEFQWCPVPPGAFSPPEVHPQQSPHQVESVNSAVDPGKYKSPVKYVPPHLRGKSKQPEFKVREEELPQNLRPKSGESGSVSAGQEGQLSKTALKNKKKREAAVKRKQEEGVNESATGGLATKMREVTVAPSTNKGSDLTDVERKIRAVYRKLDQIEELKRAQTQGKDLEANQLEKIKKESELHNELKSLQKVAAKG